MKPADIARFDQADALQRDFAAKGLTTALIQSYATDVGLCTWCECGCGSCCGKPAREVLRVVGRSEVLMPFCVDHFSIAVVHAVQFFQGARVGDAE